MAKSLIKVIRLHCLECAGTPNEVKLCTCTDCNLYPYRFGKNPHRKRTMTDEQKEAMKERLAKAREKSPQYLKGQKKNAEESS